MKTEFINIANHKYQGLYSLSLVYFFIIILEYFIIDKINHSISSVIYYNAVLLLIFLLIAGIVFLCTKEQQIILYPREFKFIDQKLHNELDLVKATQFCSFITILKLKTSDLKTITAIYTPFNIPLSNYKILRMALKWN